MYSLHDYARMIADEGRIGPYVRALEMVVRPGSVVADIGTGTGILALVACRLGARRVFAVDTNDAISVARELARENGFADRIVFYHGDVREVELPERADVIVSDLRGSLPLHGEHLSIIADVRSRFLKPGGVLVPASDRLMVAVVETPNLYEWAVGPTHGPLGVTLQSMHARLCNATFVDPPNHPLESKNVVSSHGAWATLHYADARSVPMCGRAELLINRAATGHGLAIWFEAVLAGEHGFSSAPGQQSLCYAPLFLPWPRPVSLTEGDTVSVEIWAQADGAPWGWTSSVPAGLGTREHFKQSNFLSWPSRPTSGMRRERLALSHGNRS